MSSYRFSKDPNTDSPNWLSIPASSKLLNCNHSLIHLLTHPSTNQFIHAFTSTAPGLPSPTSINLPNFHLGIYPSSHLPTHPTKRPSPTVYHSSTRPFTLQSLRSSNERHKDDEDTIFPSKNVTEGPPPLKPSIFGSWNHRMREPKKKSPNSHDRLDLHCPLQQPQATCDCWALKRSLAQTETSCKRNRLTRFWSFSVHYLKECKIPIHSIF